MIIVKYKLQWKFAGIMFISLFLGILYIALVEGMYGYTHQISAEATERIFETGEWAVYFDLSFIGVVVLVFFLLSRSIIKRIEKLDSSIEQISRGNMKNIHRDTHHDELGTLSQSIHKMAEMLDESLEKEQAMVRNIAHDLRTPVTSIQGYAQLLERSKELSTQDREYVATIIRQSEHLAQQIEELLEYSILQFKEKEYDFETLSLSSLLEQIIIDFIPQLDSLDMQFSMVGNEAPHMISCNQNLMIRLLENLINNAIRYGKKGKMIEAEISEDEEHVYLELANYGSTMTREQMQNIFEPFFQGAAAREYATESKGLGLAIAAQIVAIHHGTITVQCMEETQKTVFLLSFPK